LENFSNKGIPDYGEEIENRKEAIKKGFEATCVFSESTV